MEQLQMPQADRAEPGSALHQVAEAFPAAACQNGRPFAMEALQINDHNAAFV